MKDKTKAEDSDEDYLLIENVPTAITRLMITYIAGLMQLQDKYSYSRTINRAPK